MIPTETRAWAAVAQQTCERLGCSCGDETFFFSPNDFTPPDEEAAEALGHLEHLVHELCHAVLLDLPVAPCLGHRISFALSLHTITRQVDEEARAWAVEYNVWRAIGFDAVLALDDALLAAEVQGVERGVLQSLLDEDWEEPTEDVVALLERHCRPEDDA